MILLSILLIFCESYSGTYSGGNGSASDPYKISNISDLEELMDTQGDWGSYFILTQNIDCSAHSWQNDNPQPIGSSSTQFTGNFDGQGNIISNINFNISSILGYVGFFGNIGSSASVSYLSLVDVNTTGESKVGSFCGSNEGTIYYCHTDGDADANFTVGGFCGSNLGTISNCSAAGDADATNNSAGGFCGSNFWWGNISNCSASGNATGNVHIGGFCGFSLGTISNCSASGNATASNENAGGFCGSNSRVIEYCFSYGATTSPSNSGGFVGFSDDDPYFNPSYTCCFWNESVNLGLNDAGNISDLPNVEPLSAEEFTNPSNFSCFEFGSIWLMSDTMPILAAFVIPTLTEWAVILFIGLLAGVGGWFVWRRM